MNKNQLKLYVMTLEKVMYKLIAKIIKSMKDKDYYTAEFSAKLFASVAEMFQGDIFWHNITDDEDDITLVEMYDEGLLYDFAYDVFHNDEYNESHLGGGKDTFYEVNKDYGLCTDEEVEGLLKELEYVYENR